MPKDPITYREIFFTRLKDGSYRFLDVCLVNTALGAMLEPWTPARAGAATPVTQIDIVDASFNKMTELSEEEAANAFVGGGAPRTSPISFDY